MARGPVSGGMRTLRLDRGVGGAVRSGPVGRQQGVEFVRAGHGQALDDVLEVGLRIDAEIAGTDEQGIHDRGTFAGFGAADEQPVLFADGTWPDVVLGVVVVDLDAAVFKKCLHGGPLAEGVVERLAQSALGPDAGGDEAFEGLG